MTTPLRIKLLDTQRFPPTFMTAISQFAPLLSVHLKDQICDLVPPDMTHLSTSSPCSSSISFFFLETTTMNNSDSAFATLPHQVDVHVNLPTFKISVARDEISKLEALLELCSIAQPTWENSRSPSNFGVYALGWLMR